MKVTFFRWLTVGLCCLPTAGCGGMFHGSPGIEVANPAHAMKGLVHGGQQPVSGSAIQLYAVGTGGDGSASVPLLSAPVMTDQNGQFSIASYTCPSVNSPLYLTASQGNPGLNAGMNNPAIAEMTALGACSALSATSFVVINEITTVAAVDALAPFMKSAAAVGSGTDDAAGLAAAFNLAAEFADSTSGLTPGRKVPAGTAVPFDLIDSLADVVAACVNSSGGVAGDGSTCGMLFSLTTPAGTAPVADTITALLRIAQNPATNVSQIYNLAMPGAPFQPTLLSAPSSLAVTTSGPAFKISTSSITTASVPVGYTSPLLYATVTNSGTVGLTMNAIAVSGSDPSDFAVVSQCTSLAVKASCVMSVAGNPTQPGARSATLTISESTGSLQQSVALVTTGYATVRGILPGATVQLPFQEGTGTVAHDLSANHNDCTFGSGMNAPLWMGAGVDFFTPNTGPAVNGAWCSLPASVTISDASATNARTKMWCGYLRPLNGLTGNPDFTVLLASSISNGVGAMWMSWNGTQYHAAYYGGILAGSTPTTSTPDSLVGWHCVSETLGSSTDSTVDHLYSDGAEVADYTAQGGSSWDNRQAGEFEYVGYAPWLPAAWTEDIVSYVLEYPTVLTPSQIASNVMALQQTAFYGRGVGSLPGPNLSSQNQIVCNGDSLTHGAPYGVTAFCDELSGLDQSFQVTPIAVGGQNLMTANSNVPLIDAPIFAGNAKYNFLSQEAGIDDYLQDVVSLRVKGALLDQQAGFHVLWFTMPSVGQNDAAVQQIDSQLRALAPQMGVTLVDDATDPCLGATGAYANPAPCSDFVDGVHLSQAGADSYLKSFVNVINYLTGSTAANPTSVSVPTYSMVAHDGYVSVYPLGSSTSITLPSCVGFSATTPFVVANTSETASVTVTALAGQTPSQQVNGASAAVSVPNLGILTLISTPLPPATAGCSWTAQ